MEREHMLVDHTGGIHDLLESVLFALGEKFLTEIPNTSFIDLGAASTTLQKLVSCYVDLKPFSKGDSTSTPQAISPEVVNAIQSQLNLL